MPTRFFVDIDKVILKLVWKHVGHRMTKTILTKNKVRGITLADIKAYYTAVLIRTL